MRKIFLLQLKSHSLEGPPALHSSPSSRSPRCTCRPQAQPWFPFSSITALSLQPPGASLQAQSNLSSPRSPAWKHFMEETPAGDAPRGHRATDTASERQQGTCLQKSPQPREASGRRAWVPSPPPAPAPAILVHSGPCLGNTSPCIKGPPRLVS